MIQKISKQVLPLLLVSLVIFGIDRFLFDFYFPNLEVSFIHSIQTVFFFFIFCSVIIITVLWQVKQNNINSVGQTFMLITCIKMVLAFLLAKPILSSVSEISKIEKYHFLIIFAVFLVIETVITIKMLSKNK